MTRAARFSVSAAPPTSTTSDSIRSVLTSRGRTWALVMMWRPSTTANPVPVKTVDGLRVFWKVPIPTIDGLILATVSGSVAAAWVGGAQDSIAVTSASPIARCVLRLIPRCN
jgi:hypothetical protein